MFGKLRDSWVVWRKKVSEKFEKFNPEPKTEEMTVPVGVDSEGKLWTSGEGGGGGEKHYLIHFIYDSGSAEDDGGYDLTFKPVVDYYFSAGDSSNIYHLNAGESYTISIQNGENTGGVYGISFNGSDVYERTPNSLYVYEYEITNSYGSWALSDSLRIEEVAL